MTTLKPFDSVDYNKLWKVPKRDRIPDYLTCPLRNLYAGQEATVRKQKETEEPLDEGERRE